MQKFKTVSTIPKMMEYFFFFFSSNPRAKGPAGAILYYTKRETSKKLVHE